MEIKYEYNWCEMLTPCPNNKNCMVGEYECECQCEHFVSRKVVKDIENKNGVENLKRYFEIGEGILICNFK